MKILDINFVRECFPAFSYDLPAKTAFFENAGGSYVAGPVVKRLTHFYTANKVQPYGASEICSAAGEQMDLGRLTMADLLGVDRATITLGPSTTQNINTLANACAAQVGSGDSVIVTGQDHEANIGAWERLCARQGATLKIWPVDPVSGELALDDLRSQIDETVKIIGMTHSSNIVGSVNPVDQVIALARSRNIRVVVDGVSYAPHKWPDIPTLQPDAYCFSTYKTYATHLGVMYVAPDWAQELDPQCHFFNVKYPEKRFDAAGPDHASIAALAGLGDYLEQSFRHHFGEDPDNLSLYQRAMAVSDLMHRHETDLCRRLLQAVVDLPLRIVGKSGMENREANIALTSSELTSAQLSKQLANNDIAAGHGDFYATRLLKNVGIPDTADGVLRISFAHYNTAEEVDRVVETLQRILN
ncbi:MAG: aminotransferase class V-fold PLP-dependent enzyme [Pseudomonadota bacterium]